MAVIEGLLLIGLQHREHGPVMHVVAVEDGGQVCHIGPACAVYENTAGRIIAAVRQMAQVGVVGLSLEDGIVYDGVRHVDPAFDIGIGCLESLEIHLDGAEVRQCQGLSGSGLLGRGLHLLLRRQRGLGNILGGGLLIGYGSPAVFAEDQEKAVAAVEKDAKAYDKQDRGKCFFHRTRR